MQYRGYTQISIGDMGLLCSISTSNFVLHTYSAPLCDVTVFLSRMRVVRPALRHCTTTFSIRAPIDLRYCGLDSNRNVLIYTHWAIAERYSQKRILKGHGKRTRTVSNKGQAR